jgi:hypothetical protein
MKFNKSVTILYSTDVKASVEYFTKELGFTDSWIWDDAAGFGGISRDEVEIFFCLKDQGSPGTWLSIMVDDVDAYYESIRNGKAEILSPPDTKPWLMREMLVRAPDGHIIRFGNPVECEPES